MTTGGWCERLDRGERLRTSNRSPRATSRRRRSAGAASGADRPRGRCGLALTRDREALELQQGRPAQDAGGDSEELKAAFESSRTSTESRTRRSGTSRRRLVDIPDIKAEIEDVVAAKAETELSQQIDSDTEKVAGARQFAEDELAEMFDQLRARA